MARSSVVLVLLLVSSPALAETERFVLGGVVAGRSLHPTLDNGFILGAEVSGGWIFDTRRDESGNGIPTWVGAYVDTLYDFGTGTTRLSFGPEVGLWYIGLDGGLVRELDDGGRFGFAIRPAITVGMASLFVRYTRFVGDEPEADHVEVGVLLKYPFKPDIDVR